MENDIAEKLEEVRKTFKDVFDALQVEQEQFWESLSTDDQLKAFCAVMRRLHKGELEDQRSYRGVLYDVFGFGTEAYAQAQLAGFLDIHNSIYAFKNEAAIVRSFCERFGIEDVDQKIMEFCL